MALTNMLRRAAMSRSYGSLTQAAENLSPAVSKFNDIVAERAVGCEVWDTEGRRWLDFTSGIGVLSTGHCHPRVVKAIQQQAAGLIFAQQNILPATPATLALLQRLRRIVPDHLSRFFFCNSGSEAVDNAIKVARNYTGRQNIIAFTGAYHGRTYGAMAVTSSKTVYRQTFGPLPSGVAIAPYPYCLRCKARVAAGGLGYGVAPNVEPLGRPYGERTCCNGPLEELEMMLKMQTHPKETAAVLIEPIMGEGGFLTPPPGFLASLRTLCDEHGMLLIFDEVQAGMGRTGSWWSYPLLTEAQPDVLIFAKGIASGVPFAGLATRPQLYDRMDPGMMGGTYGGSALGCAAAVATIDVIEKEGLLSNATQRGAQLMEGLVALSRRFPITDVRGRGLMVAAELEAAPGAAGMVMKAAADRGLLILTAGARETVRFLPPLVASEGEVQEALALVEASLEEAFSDAKK